MSSSPSGGPSAAPGKGVMQKWQSYLHRAAELDGPVPVVAFYSRYYVVENLMRLRKQGVKDAESEKTLISLLGKLEEMKKQNEADKLGHDRKADCRQVEEFCLAVFKRADDLDRSGECTNETAMKFFVASKFFDVLEQFDTLDFSATKGEATSSGSGSAALPRTGSQGQLILPDFLEEKRKYAKFKASYIRDCLKRGETPIPGPPGGQQAAEDEVEALFKQEEEMYAQKEAQHPNPVDASIMPGGIIAGTPTAASSSSAPGPFTSPDAPTQISPQMVGVPGTNVVGSSAFPPQHQVVQGVVMGGGFPPQRQGSPPLHFGAPGNGVVPQPLHQQSPQQQQQQQQQPAQFVPPAPAVSMSTIVQGTTATSSGGGQNSSLSRGVAMFDRKKKCQERVKVALSCLDFDDIENAKKCLHEAIAALG
ncbi:unnamed protein product [Amoebophrya sp. A25]|nr:unnamed protein product [Amoebophrya sp. A25]|eukprot:GSA25T00000898001.1